MGALSPVHFLLSLLVLAVVVGVVAGIVLLIVKASKSTVFGAKRADWYPDPQNPAMARYFDGSSWTSHTQPRRGVPYP